MQSSLFIGEPRDLRSVGRAVGAIPRSFTYLRGDPSTLAARQPGPFAGFRKRRQPRPTTARWSRSPDRDTSASTTEGARASKTRRGARDRPASAMRVSRFPRPSLGDARPMLPGEAIARAPSLHRGLAPNSARSSPRKRRRPRKGYAERVDRRHGSLASSHGRIEPGRARPRTLAVSASAPDSRPRAGWKHSERENEVARSPVSSGWCKSPGRHALRKQ